MKRDMDLVRQILLEIEVGKRVFDIRSNEMSRALGIEEESSMSREEADKWEYHLNLMQESGLVEFRRFGGGWLVEGMTWSGHDFLDSVRDPDVWDRTKAGALQAGGFTVELLKDLAKGFIKKQIEDRTGISL
ncbi:hypothetical protein BA939_19940 [Rhizobium sp. S41]|nr:hypothetical protein BA939_19940 [Rhizobium sp. S41]KGE80308.1 hypothetical protein LW14_23800 [Rhizobium sp. H41]